MSQSTLFQCSADKKCPENLCCGKDGFCSSAADACDAKNGCQHNCKDIPDPRQCKDFKSALFPNMQQTKTRPMFAVSRNVPAMRPPPGSAAGANCTDPPQVDYPLQPCDLVEAMGGPDTCKYCLYYYDRIREAVESYDMVALTQPACDATERKGSPRLAAFLAQVRHETNALSTMFQKLDNGAGAIHMIPAHFESVAAGIPRLKKAIDQILPGLEWKSAMADAALQRIIGLIVSYPEHTFLTAGWWVTSGAAKRLNPDCGDLRVAADLGRGNGMSDVEASGFYKVSRCIYGSVMNDPGLGQRLEYYELATKVTELFTPVPANTPLSPPTETPTDDGLGMQPENPGFFSGPIAFVGSFAVVLVGLMAMILVYDRCVRRRRVGAAAKGSKHVGGDLADQSSNESASERSALTPRNDARDLELGGAARRSSMAGMRPRSDSGTVYIIEHVDDDEQEGGASQRQTRPTSAASNYSRPGSVYGGHMGRSTSPHPKRVSSAASIHSMSFQMQIQAAAAAEQSRRMSVMSVQSAHGSQQLARSSSNQSVVMMHPAVVYTHQQPAVAQVARPSTAPAPAAQLAPRASIMSMDSVMGGNHVAMIAQHQHQTQPIAPILVMNPLPAPVPAADPALSSPYVLYHQAVGSVPQIVQEPMQFGYYHHPEQQVLFELGSQSGSSEDPTSSDTVPGPGSNNGIRPVSRHSQHFG